MPFYYSAFGLDLCVDRPISGLRAAPDDARADLCVRLRPDRSDVPDLASRPPWYVSTKRDARGEPQLKIWQDPQRQHFWIRYSDGAAFVVDRRGTRIDATWPPTLTQDDALVYLLGFVLSFVLRLRGVVCLHASAVAIGDRAVAFIGEPGAGKSTTAAAFAAAGYPVLTDDLLALHLSPPAPLAQPGLQRMNLTPDSAQALLGSTDALHKLAPTWDKWCVDLTNGPFRRESRALPLMAIYHLADRRPAIARPVISPLVGHTGLTTLVAHTFANKVLDAAMRAHEFDVLTQVLARVPFRGVVARAGFAELGGLREAILEDLDDLDDLDGLAGSASKEAGRACSTACTA